MDSLDFKVAQLIEQQLDLMGYVPQEPEVGETWAWPEQATLFPEPAEFNQAKLDLVNGTIEKDNIAVLTHVATRVWPPYLAELTELRDQAQNKNTELLAKLKKLDALKEESLRSEPENVRQLRQASRLQWLQTNC